MFRTLVPWRERALSLTPERFPRAIQRMEEEMEGLMDRLFRPEEGWLTPTTGFVPSVDLTEREGAFEVTVDLPGLKPEDVTVEVVEGNLQISGEKQEEKEEKGKTFHRIERRHGEFRRLVQLPALLP